jgi:hypothetical protein
VPADLIAVGIAVSTNSPVAAALAAAAGHQAADAADIAVAIETLARALAGPAAPASTAT